jgi:hypothetical protein
MFQQISSMNYPLLTDSLIKESTISRLTELLIKEELLCIKEFLETKINSESSSVESTSNNFKIMLDPQVTVKELVNLSNYPTQDSNIKLESLPSSSSSLSTTNWKGSYHQLSNLITNDDDKIFDFVKQNPKHVVTDKGHYVLTLESLLGSVSPFLFEKCLQICIELVPEYKDIFKPLYTTAKNLNLFIYEEILLKYNI